ncbi:glutathione S-transferase C-terminal domain-containing protein [Diaphorina citri]|uniref:Glutathione S-transferase C-terminal domain-containing protein n=1 Tax=Diaphorina citri TaxID=121845 RepID=A0A1S3DFC6_DIACI|nr:glutathione S-transferase C-terminal domain-containing protein [Diaphorina citri]XP_026684756.1 glutathione S-transferase C-terminal domain-containing protein [Diaphorina citri]KAI5756167.1 hypothetical protein M8J77_022706 [Diaphorina citri]
MSIFLEYTKLGESKNEIYCPIESCIVLALIDYIKISDEIRVFLSEQKDSKTSILINTQDIPLLFAESIDPPVKYCQLPAYYDNGFYCVAGLCSVLREIIKTEGTCIHMLGFRENCLSACSEQSSWTKFCEVDSMICIENFLNGNNKWIGHIENIESNLKQPLKIHNKVCPKDPCVEEVMYIDSENFSLSDFILVLCVHIITIHTRDGLFSQFPFVKKWYDNVMSDSSLLNITCMFSSMANKQLKYIEVQKNGSDETGQSQPMSKSQKARKFTARAEDAIQFVNTIKPRIKQQGFGYGHEIYFDKAQIPYFALPESGDIPQDRVERKCQQLVSMTKAVMKICSPNDVIVDFCSGGGHLGLLIAHLVPQCTVILLDNKPQSLARAKHRTRELGLTNLFIIQSNVNYFIGTFDVGTCLHACGVASDLVMQKCARNNASMVVSPCCYGKIQTCHTMQYPRSQWLQQLNITSQDHHLMSHCADRQSPDWMDWIDADRLEWAQENGYHIFLGKLTPLECTPKNNMLVASKWKKLLPEETPCL